MIRLKLNREQLCTLCEFTNPAKHEARVKVFLKAGAFENLDTLFNIVQIGEMVSKKYLFSNNKKYSISLKYSEAGSLLKLTYDFELILDPLSYELNLALIIRAELHNQLTNYQTKYNGQQHRQTFAIGGNSSYIRTLDKPAR